MTLKRKLLRVFSLFSGLLLILFAVFLFLRLPIFNPYPQQYVPDPRMSDQGVSTCQILYLFLDVILLVAGIALTVASYYHGEGSGLLWVANEEQSAQTD